MNLTATCHGSNNALWFLCAQAAMPLPVRGINGVSDENLINQTRDADLLKRISNSDRAAFAEFYDLYSGLLFSVAIKILNDPKEAEDVIQDVFLQIWEKAGSFDARLGKATSWAITFVRNKSIDRIRASVRRTRLVENATAEAAPADIVTPTANDSVVGREKAELIRAAVVNLPAEQRQAIELAFFTGLTQDEISKRLKEPLGTIKARIRRGMLKLRERLEGRL